MLQESLRAALSTGDPATVFVAGRVWCGPLFGPAGRPSPPRTDVALAGGWRSWRSIAGSAGFLIRAGKGAGLSCRQSCDDRIARAWKPLLLCLALVRMRPRTFVFITMVVLCHSLLGAQVLTNGLPPSQSGAEAQDFPSPSLPDDPGQEALPIAQPEPLPSAGVPVRWKA